VWRFLCSLPAVNSSDVHPMFAYPSPPVPSLHTAAAFNYSTAPWQAGACCKLLMQAINVTNLGGPDIEQTSIDGNRVWHGLTSWLIALLIDCFPAYGVRVVTFISPHSADVKRKLLKLLHKYIYYICLYKQSSNLIQILAVEIRIWKKTRLTSPNRSLGSHTKRRLRFWFKKIFIICSK